MVKYSSKKYSAATGHILSKTNTKKPYRIIRKIGCGAFGTVYYGRLRKTNESVAIKETFQNPKYANREGDMCRKFKHPNIVKFHDVSYEYKEDNKYLVLVMDYYPNALQTIIDERRKRRDYFRYTHIQKIAYQIFNALAYMHSFNIAHRDIKPDNILIDMKTLKVVIADLGSAKQVYEGYNKSYICSRVYRAPELVLGCEHYTPLIDNWSVGCVLVECILLKTLFEAKSQEHLFRLMQKLLGKINEAQMKKLVDGKISGMKPVQHSIMNPFDKLFAKTKWNASVALKNLLVCLFQWDPQLRISATDAMQHSFFFQMTEQ